MKNDKLNIAIIFGGKSVEHDISIISALLVSSALNKAKYNKYLIYITKNNKLLIGKELDKIETYQNSNFKKAKEVILTHNKNDVFIKRRNKLIKIDAFINVVHGEGIEDGTLSGILNFINGASTSNDITFSSIAQDKIFTKDILKRINIPTLRYLEIKRLDNATKTKINTLLRYPLIVKPARLGSSIGIEKVYSEEELEEKTSKVFKYSDRLIIEEMIESITEYNCAAFKYNNEIYVSEIEEVKTDNEFLNFEDKYINKKTKENTNRLINPNISDELKLQIKTYTKEIYEKLDGCGVIRIDYIYDVRNNKLYFNEINSIPGSLSYYLFEPSNIPFSNLLDMLIKEAILKKQRKSNLITYFDSNVLNSTKYNMKK